MRFMCSVLHQRLQHVYSLHEFTICPSRFGLPKKRLHRVMIWLRKDRRQWTIDNPEGCLLDTFGSKIVASANIFYTAPQARTQARIRALAASRGFPPTRPGQKGWSYFQIAPPGTRYRILAHERAIAQHGADLNASFFFPVDQRPEFHPPSTILPCLLRNSLIWSTSARRFNSGAEAFECMGMGPIFFQSDYSDHDCNRSSAPCVDEVDLRTEVPLFREVARGEGFTDSQLREFAGNGFAVDVIGLFLLFLFSHTEPVS